MIQRTRLFSPFIYNAADDQLRREHNARERRWTVVLSVVLAVGISLLVWLVRRDFN